MNNIESTVACIRRSVKPVLHKCAHNNAFLWYSTISQTLLFKSRDRSVQRYNLGQPLSWNVNRSRRSSNLEAVFTSDGRRNKESHTRIGKENAFLRELYRSVVTKRELLKSEKLSVFRSVFVPILTNGHDYWNMTERVLSQVQAARIFAKASRRDASRQSAELRNL